MKRVNLIAASILLIFCGWYAYLTYNLPDRNLPGTLGIDFMPWVLVICLGSLSGLLLIQGLVAPAPTSPGTNDPSFSRREIIGVVSLTVLVFLYIKAIAWLGYLISTPIYLASLMLVSGFRKWVHIILVSLLATGGIYLFFNKVFQIQLPGGTW
jgi:hypothetical protein